MATVYVAGDVPESNQHSLLKVYSEIEEYFSARGFQVQVPGPESRLDQLGPGDFQKEIAERIYQSDFVISVIGLGSPAAAVESTIASFQGKTQAILIPTGKTAPRVLSGLPNVIAVGDYSQVRDVISQLYGEQGPDSLGGGVRRPPQRPRPEPKRRRPQSMT